MSADGHSRSSEKTQTGAPEGFLPGEPIAIVGMACRFPGSERLSDFWQQLITGENLVVEGPPGSVVGRAGRLFPDSDAKNDAVRFGAFVEDIDLFDAEFFRMSPIEAQMLDPQQRMMLETSWKALEDAAIDPESLKGSRTGVYAGISNNDYRNMVINAPETVEPAGGLYAVTGTALNTAIGRVSFAFGLEGPSMAIDTACSSSLVAIHQAVGGLQRRETDLALAGGVHIFLAGRPLELRANAGMLSPEGQCKTFDASADGFVCGEGCGLLALKRLGEAQADGDRIWAVIRGSSVNQDGASQGLTVPSGHSQERAMEEALARAGASPSEMDYLEAHGTGTVVGDPIEVNAAAAVYGHGRGAKHPLLIGSVKTNIGHLGPAAGVAGLIKTVLSMKHGVIPQHLNFKNPNPRLDWDNLPVRVTDVMMDWPRHPGKPLLAGVNSFGWSGTNAHMVVEGYGEPEADTACARMSSPVGASLPVAISPRFEEKPGVRETRFLPVSAKSRQALRDTASRYLSWLDERVEELSPESTAADPTLSDMAWTAAIGRSHFTRRAGIVFSDLAGLREKLEALAEGEGPEDHPAQQAKRVAFVFTGQASQWVGMGRALYEREPVFRSVLDRCDQLLLEERGVSLLDVMFGRGGTDGLLDEAAWTQPAIYSLECALVALWESVGVKPNALVGHSLGEIAAAQAAGVFTLEEGLRCVAVRGALMGATRSDGAMAAVFAPASRVASIVAEHNAASDDLGLSIAADNGLQQVVSGPAKDIEALQDIFEAEGIKVARLRRSPAYHSALVEPALDDLESAVRGIAPAPPPPSVPLVSNITGHLLDENARMDAAYWRRHAREPVAFRQCVETLAELGVDVVVEIGPHAVLGPLVSMTWPESAPAGGPVVLHSLQRPPRDAEESEVDTSDGFVEATAGAYEAGLELDFVGLFAGETRRRISLPGYPFQRARHWVQTSKPRRQVAGHPLLGARHESPRGEMTYETVVFRTDPAWMVDHLVYERVVAPGGLYGAMAVSVSLANGNGPAIVEDMQMHNALVFEEEDADDGADDAGRQLQFVLDGPADALARRFEIFSKGETEEGWTLHAEGKLFSGAPNLEEGDSLDLDELKARLVPRDTAKFYQMRSADDIYLGPSYHTVKAVWAREGEALGELVLKESVDANGMEMHPLLLDGCFQVLSMARYLTGVEHVAVYMPFGWERLWVSGPMPERIICHAVLGNPASENVANATSNAPPEVVTGDVRFYSTDGVPIGGLLGYTVKRATRTALLSAKEGLKDLLYEVDWREKPLSRGMPPTDFLADPAAVASRSRSFADYLADEGVEAPERSAFLRDLERLSRAYALAALERLGWERNAGATIRPEGLRRELKIVDEHQRLFGRLLRMLSDAGVLTPVDEEFVVEAGAGEPLPDESFANPGTFVEQLAGRHPHGAGELGLLRRCGSALAEVLQGRADPLPLLFGEEGPGAADLYRKAPASRAANRMLGDAVAAAVSALPADRRLRVLEVGAGTGSATAAILPLLPDGRFEYTFTDISAGFFAQAEEHFEITGASIEYQPLDIEADPVSQGFDSHGYDLVIAANVLHATRDLGETLVHCRDLLAPSGQLIALEGLQRRAWQDLTFGLLDGWWRFDDAYRPDHALADPVVWHRALSDAGFSDVEFLGPANADSGEIPGSSAIIARGPEEVDSAPGVWVIASDEDGTAAKLAVDLALRNQIVFIAGGEREYHEVPDEGAGVTTATLDPKQRESWRSLLEGLPRDAPLKGVVHLMALDGHGAAATTQEMEEDVTRAASTALALVQGMSDVGATPADGVWFITRGAQVLDQDYLSRVSGELAGATLWGLGKVLALEAAHLQPRLIDLDPAPRETATSSLIDELLFPDPETHIAYRGGSRYAARLIRCGADDTRFVFPEDAEWCIGSDDPEAGLAALRAKPRPRSALEPGEVRVAVEAMGLNFADMLKSMGAVPYDREIGREMYGRVLETAQDVEGLSVSDQVVGIGFGSFSPEMVTRAVMTVPVPAGFSPPALATVPICFVTAELAFELAGLKSGERVLIHAGAGGVGLAAIQLAHAAGAEVFATASLPKQKFLRSMGVEHVYDSRTTAFGQEVLEATGGEGVHVLLNSLTGEGFIEANLSCLGTGGRFVEISKRSIWGEEEMATSRPDVAYSILDLDALNRDDPARPGASLSRVMARLSAGELTPLPHTVWPLSEIRSAMEVMRDARHIGKNVLRMPSLVRSNLREDRTYLVTGGMGGIGCAVARWLAENGAGTIVLNGRRDPDLATEEVIRELRESGVDVRVEVADVTDLAAVDDMLARIDEDLLPIGGVIHSVGVLSDGVIENQTWERFEQVMWPKVLGAWHLHQATRTKDLDMFILFSSVTGVVGNSGQSNHAAANAFLDQLAAHRRTLGLPGQAIAWGAWSGIGEAEEQRKRIERQLTYTGAGWLTPRQGMEAFDWLVRQDVTAPTVTMVNWSVIARGLETHPPFFEDILVATKPEDRESEDSAPSASLLSRLRDTPAEEQQNLLESFIQQELQAVLRLSSPPSTTVSFFDMGMDSLMAVELRNRLNRAFDDEYTASNTVVFDFPDITALARHLAAEIGGIGAAAATLKPPTLKRQKPRRREHDGDDIAIVGMACRFPGAPDLAAFWRQLEAGESAVMDGRRDAGPWNGVLGDPGAEAPVHRIGGFVDGLDLFDAGFFDILPIEARAMDPQQRLLLETSWQALEDAGMDPARLKGSRSGVYFGIANSEYGQLLKDDVHDDYFGNSMGVAVGRVSFVYGMEGPAMPVELACASSLVSIHHAVVSLQRGETDMALAGGVNVILSAESTTRMADFGMLSRSGRCWSFDAAADGYVRGEGCGVIVLKRLTDAEENGDRIWGVIRGSATNQNGASGDLVMPSGSAQRRVIEEALAQSNLKPSQVDYLEAHANGSEMGDAIEVHAAAAVYGNGREPCRPLLLGTVKTNIGHLESAAGVAGLIKVMLSIKHGMIPKHLNFENPNPNMAWDELPVRVTSKAADWPLAPDSPPRAGISAFSMTGTNAHLIVEGYGARVEDSARNAEWSCPSGSAQPVAVSLSEEIPESPTAEGLRPRRTRMLPLSGKSDEALHELAGRYLSWLDENAGELAAEDDAQSLLSDMAWTAAEGRSHFAHRAGVVFEDAASLREGLRALAESEEGAKPQAAVRVAFAYAGEEGHRVGMGEELYECEPVARAVLDRCDEVLRVQRGASLLDVMFGRIGELSNPMWSQPAVFALECALTSLWASIGIRPNLVFGAGSGEIAAAHAAGVFTLEEGLRFAARRGALMEAISDADGAGKALDDLETALEGVVTALPSLTIVNQGTGLVLGAGETMDAAYWRRQANEPAVPGECVRTLAELGVEAIVEIGPDAVIGPQALSVWPEPAGDAGASADGAGPPVVLRSLKHPTEDAPQSGRAFIEAVARAYEAGFTLDFAGLFAGEDRRRISLPGYPFQHRHFWFEAL